MFAIHSASWRACSSHKGLLLLARQFLLQGMDCSILVLDSTAELLEQSLLLVSILFILAREVMLGSRL